MNTKTKRQLKDASPLIEAMLKENTGTAICDSGGAYGRNWQRNQGRKFANEPEVKFKTHEWTNSEGKKCIDYDFSVSTFHYLTKFLALDAVCQKFNRIPCGDWDSDLAYGLGKEGEAFLEKMGAEVKKAVNTYNWDCPLDQVLQFSPLEIDGEDYVLLQIHGGCDVRGGYTDAKLFTFNHYAEPQAFGAVDVYGTLNGENIDNRYSGGSGLTLADTDEDIQPLGAGKDKACLEIMGI